MINHQIAQVINLIYEAGLTTASGGNISVQDEKDTIRITPGSTDKGVLTAREVVAVAPDGSFTGSFKPSSELPMHRAIYQSRPDIKALIHAHSPALVAFSLTHQIPDTRVWYHAWKWCNRVGYAPYALPGSTRLGALIADEFATGCSSVILENHGVVVGGKDLYEVYERFLVLEFCAQAIIDGLSLGKPVTVPESLLEAASRSRPDPTVKKGTQPTPELTGLANDLIRFLQRSLKQRLMTNSCGMMSVRSRPGHFLLTTPLGPGRISGSGYLEQVAIDHQECAGQDYLTRMHQSIYQENPKIQAIITTQAPFLMAHALTEQLPDPATLPESWLFLGQIRLLTFSEGILNPSLIPSSFRDAAALIIANDSVTVAGDSLFQAFDRLELAEFTARSMALTRRAGPIYRLSQQQLDELNKTYLHET